MWQVLNFFTAPQFPAKALTSVWEVKVNNLDHKKCAVECWLLAHCGCHDSYRVLNVRARGLCVVSLLEYKESSMVSLPV